MLTIVRNDTFNFNLADRPETRHQIVEARTDGIWLSLRRDNENDLDHLIEILIMDNFSDGCGGGAVIRAQGDLSGHESAQGDQFAKSGVSNYQ